MTNIVELLRKYDFIPAIKNNNQYMYNCCFHDDKTASLSVNVEKELYNCFGCGAKGNLKTLAKYFNEEVINNKTGYDYFTEPQEDLKLKARGVITSFLENNKDNLVLLNENNTDTVYYLDRKKLNTNTNYNSYRNNYYVTINNIYNNNILINSHSLIVVNDDKTLIQIIDITKPKERSKLFLKGSILKESYIKYWCGRNNTLTLLSEGIANHLTLQNLSNECYIFFNSICCFSSSNLENFLKTNIHKFLPDSLVICIDNDPAGEKVKNCAIELGITKFVEFNNEKKGYDINDCWVDDKLKLLNIVNNYCENYYFKV